MVLSSCN